MINKKSTILICGAGSIGIRHAKNLINLGYRNIAFFTNRKKLKIGSYKPKTFLKIQDAFRNYNFKIALITNETNRHIDTAIYCANKGCHLFIEKPLCDKKDKVKKLINIITKKKLINMVGYMMRFHPAIKQIKSMITKKSFGDIYHFYSEWGEFLPNWHPNENYKKSYAAQKNKGGGSTLTLSHDIDLMQFLFGKIKKSLIIKNKIGLKIQSETSTNIMLQFKKNVSGFIHLDYLQKNEERFLKISGTKMIIKFYYLKNMFKIYRNKKIKIIKYGKFHRNLLFLSEIKYFINNCKNLRICSPNINQAYKNLLDLKLI